MISTNASKIDNIIVHGIGNKINGDSCIFSKNYLTPSAEISDLLSKYFLSSFKNQETYHFIHDSSLTLNEIYVYASEVFDNPERLIEKSINIGKHLYEQSIYPMIKSGELYVVYFTDCLVDGEVSDAIGIFKSENKETFLKVYNTNNEYGIGKDNGININKLDKGCIIYNAERENGFIVSVVDNTSKGTEAKYWVDDFLHIGQREDIYYNTHNLMSMCKSYVVSQLPNEFDVSKADQAELLNKSARYFKENDSFDMQSFTNEVITQQDIIDSFNSYKKIYQEDLGIEIAEEFDISSSAVKKQARAFKSVIKLDKNFHIYVHGNNQHIKRGYDEVAGMYYYQLFFKEEL